MAVTVKEITLWRREIENQPGTLARVLEPLAKSAADVQVLMAYRYPGDETRGAVEVFPISGKKATGRCPVCGPCPGGHSGAVGGGFKPGWPRLRGHQGDCRCRHQPRVPRCARNRVEVCRRVWLRHGGRSPQGPEPSEEGPKEAVMKEFERATSLLDRRRARDR